MLHKKLSLIFFLLIFFSGSSFAVTLKLATMAPKGTTWGDALTAMGKEIKKETEGKVKLRLYLGGVKGDEPNVLRQMNSGLIHGGVFTGRALGDINGDIRIMEVPFNFLNDRDLAWKTLQSSKIFFNQGFEKKGFFNLGFFEIGLVYLVSTKKFGSIEELKGRKIWAWAGDDISSNLIKSMGLIGIPLGLQDVLTSLSTGMIETAYSSPLGVLALQWQTKIKYLVDFPVTYSVGALLLKDKFWKKVPAKFRDKVKAICAKHVAAANEKTKKENIQALQALKGMGIEFLKFPEKDIKRGKEIRIGVIKDLEGKLFSKDAVQLLNKSLAL